MELPKLDDVYVAIAAMAPGFVILYLRSQFVSGRLPTFKEGAIYYIMISTLYYAIAIPIVSVGELESAIHSLILFFIAPVCVGILLGISYDRQFFRKIARRHGLNTVHTAPSAWDLMFAQTRTRPWTWVVVTTTDNERIHGLFGGQSFASSDGSNRDLLIERLADSDFRLVERQHGLWIKESSIKFIEFIPD